MMLSLRLILSSSLVVLSLLLSASCNRCHAYEEYGGVNDAATTTTTTTTTTTVGHRSLVRGGMGAAGCPNHDETYTKECLDHAVPQYPICQRRTAAEWVEKALNEGFVHCCGEDNDLQHCRCPQKGSEHFQSKILDYCQGMVVCQAQKVGEIDTR